jgi:hypothetical protein
MFTTARQNAVDDERAFGDRHRHVQNDEHQDKDSVHMNTRLKRVHVNTERDCYGRTDGHD